MIYFPAAPN